MNIGKTLMGLGAAGIVATCVSLNVENHRSNERTRAELEGLRMENRALAADTLEKSLQIKELRQNVLNERKKYAATMYPKQLDSLKRFAPKNLSLEFYERIINNASLLDSIDNRSQRMDREVVPKIPDKVHEDIYMVGRYASKAARNLINYYHKAI